MAIGIGINLEYVRSADRDFEYGVRKAKEIGYKFVEPCVATGRDLLAEGHYYHMVSMEDDPLELKELLDSLGLKCSGLSAHAGLMKPEIGVNYIRQAIRFASDIGAPVVNTDDGLPPKWLEGKKSEQFEIMRYSLNAIMPTAERHGIYVGIEPHREYSTHTDTLLEILALNDSPYLGVNYDTGNTWLAGTDPYEHLKAVAKKVVHMHAKDIGGALMDERGKVTGTPVGVACGEGIIDWKQTIKILKGAGFHGVFSVECGTEEQAKSSIEYLKPLVA